MLQFQTLVVVSDSEMNLVGALGSFQKRREKPKKKITEKREFLRKTSFRPNRFFYIVTTEKFDFSKVSIKKFWTTKNSNVYEICRKRENLQLRFSLQ
ncbi:Uncharacterized protein FWK35_00003026 [Aphis craccivora]|uniref:Uncharacterized protein n=1 Tax=Aphis craccivora TaxID=307492 RepID=A0A6G0ZGP2_APHCR|nr:Uncharacterized protein FWK35_00003026 [Aphis craccivora]